MINFKSEITKLLNKVYRFDKFVSVLLTPVGNRLYLFLNRINEIYCTFYFDSLTEEGCEYFEELLKITLEESDTLENRRSRIQAKWLSNNHNSINLIQSVANSWKNGETIVNFKNGKILIEFINSYGIPENLNSLINEIDKIKPAHLNYIFSFKYLLIENIHNVKTIENMSEITIDKFSFGKEYENVKNN